MKLVIFGDSHVGIYNHIKSLRDSFKCVNIHHCDSEDATRYGKFEPYLMNSIATRGKIILDNYISRYSHYDYMMFIFGEPDIRIHFDKQINIIKRDEDEVINTLCKTYLNTLRYIVPSNIKIIIRYILPQREYSMFGIENNMYTPKGTLEERVRYTNKVNNKLKIECLNYKNVFFFDNILKDQLVSNSGELLTIYCDGTTHYNISSIPILEKETTLNLSNILNNSI